MKKLVAIVVAAATLSASTVVSYAQDAKAKAVLEKLSNKMKNMSSMKANFTFLAKNAAGKVQANEKGSLMLKGDKFHVTMANQEMITDGNTMWTIMKKNKEVQVSDYNPSEVTVSPTKLFNGAYEKDYNYTYAGQRTVNGKKVDIVYLTPKANKSFNSVTILVDQSGMVSSGTVEERNGNSYAYTLSGVQPNGASSDANYTFNARAYSGMEIIDLR